MMRVGVRMAVVAGVALFAVPLAFAGPITPPPGPVASTHKTLTEVEPRTAINATNTPGDADSVFRIINAGSYYVASDIVVPGGRAAIEIATHAGSVTIDLNGFTIVGQGVTSDGVRMSDSSSVRALTIRNGAIREVGIGMSLRSHRVSLCDLRFDECESSAVDILANTGIEVSRVNMYDIGYATNLPAFRTQRWGSGPAPAAIVTDCSIVGAGGAGLDLGPGSNISGGVFQQINGGAIITGDGSRIEDVTVRDGGDSPADAIRAGTGSVVLDSTIWNGGGRGFVLGAGSVISSSSVRNVLGAGFDCGAGSTVRDCSSTANGQDGFVLASQSSILSSAAHSNAGSGFTISSNSVVRECHAADNGASGIQLFSGNLVADCFAHSNGLGIHGGIMVTGASNRLERNNVVSGQRGIVVTAPNNILISNTCRNNSTNYEIASGNKAYVVFTVSSPPITGGTGGNSFGVNDPNANYSW